MFGIRMFKVRAELEYIYGDNFANLKSDGYKKLDSNTMVVNLYYNFFDLNLVKLYLNAGLGTSKLKSSALEKNKDNFTWLTGFGGNISLLETVNLDMGYRYFDMGNIKTKKTSRSINKQEIYAAIRFGF